jgi:hypothetical protein
MVMGCMLIRTASLVLGCSLNRVGVEAEAEVAADWVGELADLTVEGVVAGVFGTEAYSEEDLNALGSELPLQHNKETDVEMDEAEKNRKRGSLSTPQTTGGSQNNPAVTVNQLVNQFDGGSPAIVPPPASPQPKRDQKRHKKVGENVIDESYSGSAGSGEEHRRDQ